MTATDEARDAWKQDPGTVAKARRAAAFRIGNRRVASFGVTVEEFAAAFRAFPPLPNRQSLERTDQP